MSEEKDQLLDTNPDTETATQEESVQSAGEESFTPEERAFLDKALPSEEGQETQSSKQGSDTPKQQEPQSERPKGFDKAVKALKLDGWEDGDIEELKPERVIALGKKAQERHSAVGKKLQEAAVSKATDQSGAEDLDKDLDEDEEDTETADLETNDEEPGSAEPTGQPTSLMSKIDYKALAKPVSDAIGLGDDVQEALAKAFESALKPLQEQAALVEQQRNAMIQERGEELGQAAREKLSEKFPGLQDEEKFGKVVERMHALAKTNQNYESMEQLMLDAAKLELFDDTNATVSRRSNQVKRAQGQPTTVSRKMPTEAMSLDDKEDAVLDTLLAGKGRDAARRAYFGR